MAGLCQVMSRRRARQVSLLHSLQPPAEVLHISACLEHSLFSGNCANKVCYKLHNPSLSDLRDLCAAIEEVEIQRFQQSYAAPDKSLWPEIKACADLYLVADRWIGPLSHDNVLVLEPRSSLDLLDAFQLAKAFSIANGFRCLRRGQSCCVCTLLSAKKAS